MAPEVDLATASLFHMAGVSRHGVRLTKVEPGELVVVIGLGMIGQMSAQAARRVGARVIATDLIPLRVELAGEAFGRSRRRRQHREPGGRRPRRGPGRAPTW